MADSQRKTANLFDKDDNYTVGATTNDYMLTGLLPNHSYTCSTNFTYPTKTTASIYFGGGSSSVNGVWSDLPQTKQTDSNGNIVLHIRWKGQADAPDITEDVADGTIWIMVNEGSTPLPYEPYGWLHSLRKLGTATDTLTTLPVDLYADGTNATVGLVGNMSQTGTPTPQNPIQPSECGDRTGNLFDYQQTTGITDNCYINQSGTVVSSNDYYLSYPIEVDTNSDYTWKFNDPSSGGIIKPTHTAPSVGFYDENNNLLSAATHDSYIRYFTFTTPNNCAYIRVSVYKLYKNEAVLNMGTTPIAYQPYGYKLDIKSANTTTPVYLGEVETARNIRKYEFTGLEDWRLSSSISGAFWWNNFDNDYDNSLYNIVSTFCTHYKSVTNQTGFTNLSDRSICLYCYNQTQTNYHEVYLRDTSQNTLADFKTYLQQQYAAGTPVTLWYVLATETTGIVNEPLRKIGDYADTVSGITIPTITGKDTFDVQTTLKPSEVSLSYTGWHAATVKEWENGAWD